MKHMIISFIVIQLIAFTFIFVLNQDEKAWVKAEGYHAYHHVYQHSEYDVYLTIVKNDDCIRTWDLFLRYRRC